MHYCGVVLLEAKYKGLKKKEIKARIAELMEPYYEELDVPEYEGICDCIYCGMYSECDNYMDSLGKSSQHIDKTMDQWLHDNNLEEGDKTAIKKRQELWHEWDCQKREYYRTNLLNRRAIPDCEDCNGKGRVLTTRNLHGFWDYYEIGGRWNGWINKKEHEGWGVNGSIEENSTKGTESLIDNDLIPYAIVTPDGKWHAQEGKLFSMDNHSYSNEEWGVIAKQLFAEHEDCLAIGIDYHS